MKKSFFLFLITTLTATIDLVAQTSDTNIQEKYERLRADAKKTYDATIQTIRNQKSGCPTPPAGYSRSVDFDCNRPETLSSLDKCYCKEAKDRELKEEEALKKYEAAIQNLNNNEKIELDKWNQQQQKPQTIVINSETKNKNPFENQKQDNSFNSTPTNSKDPKNEKDKKEEDKPSGINVESSDTNKDKKDTSKNKQNNLGYVSTARQQMANERSVKQTQMIATYATVAASMIFFKIQDDESNFFRGGSWHASTGFGVGYYSAKNLLVTTRKKESYSFFQFDPTQPPLNPVNRETIDSSYDNIWAPTIHIFLNADPFYSKNFIASVNGFYEWGYWAWKSEAFINSGILFTPTSSYEQSMNRWGAMLKISSGLPNFKITVGTGIENTVIRKDNNFEFIDNPLSSTVITPPPGYLISNYEITMDDHIELDQTYTKLLLGLRFSDKSQLRHFIIEFTRIYPPTDYYRKTKPPSNKLNDFFDFNSDAIKNAPLSLVLKYVRTNRTAFTFEINRFRQYDYLSQNTTTYSISYTKHFDFFGNKYSKKGAQYIKAR